MLINPNFPNNPKEICSTILVNFIESDGGIAGINEHSDRYWTISPKNQDLKPIVLSTLLDVWFGLNHFGDINTNAKWSILNWALDTERIKKSASKHWKMTRKIFKSRGLYLLLSAIFIVQRDIAYPTCRLIRDLTLKHVSRLGSLCLSV